MTKKIKYIITLSIFLNLWMNLAISQETPINKGVTWLTSNQNPDGSWNSIITTSFDTTYIAAKSLNYLGITDTNYSRDFSLT